MVLRDFGQKIKTSRCRWPGYYGIAHNHIAIAYLHVTYHPALKTTSRWWMENKAQSAKPTIVEMILKYTILQNLVEKV